jgi:hypothetical protein
MIYGTVRMDILQVFATCLHSRPFLNGEVEKAPELFGVHSTFRSVHALSFARSGAHSRDGALAERVAPWLRKLKSEDVIVLRPLLTPCPIHFQSDASLEWGFVTDGDRGFELWQPTWKARVIGRDDDAPFKVTYTGTRYSRWSVTPPPSVAESTVRLGDCLSRVQAFLEPYPDRSLKLAVRQCFEAHHTSRLEVPGMNDLIPAGLELGAATLAASSARTYRLVTSPAWSSMAAQSETPPPILLEIWRETMGCFESAGWAQEAALRKSA